MENPNFERSSTAPQRFDWTIETIPSDSGELREQMSNMAMRNGLACNCCTNCSPCNKCNIR